MTARFEILSRTAFSLVAAFAVAAVPVLPVA